MHAIGPWPARPSLPQRLRPAPSRRDLPGWLELELRALAPRLIVAMGATALRSLLGPGARVNRERGTTLPRPDGAPVLVTVPPSSILRVPDDTARHQAYAAFVDDLRLAARAAARRSRSRNS